jgi:hypothetical protein
VVIILKPGGFSKIESKRRCPARRLRPLDKKKPMFYNHFNGGPVFHPVVKPCPWENGPETRHFTVIGPNRHLKRFWIGKYS